MKFAGFATAEATLQSFVWAARNRDTNVLFQAVNEKTAEQIRAELERKPEEFWQGAGKLPGFLITGQTVGEDDTVELSVEFVPGMEAQKIRLRREGGAWKLEM